MRVTIVVLGLLIQNASAGEWPIHQGFYGCTGSSLKIAYDRALALATQEAPEYEALCKKESGKFQWSHKKGICIETGDVSCPTECSIIAKYDCLI